MVQLGLDAVLSGTPAEITKTKVWGRSLAFNANIAGCLIVYLCWPIALVAITVLRVLCARSDA